MDALLSKKKDFSPDRKSTSGRLAAWRRRVQGLPIVIFHRVRRGGIGLILKTVAFVITVVLLVRLVPSPLNKNHAPWGWSNKEPEKVYPDLRIVAFGTQDVTNSAMDSRPGGATWTDALCRELHCTSHNSFVPDMGQSPALTSNALYAGELLVLQNRAKEINLTESPSSDFFFLEDHYPVPQTADLERQVDDFLAAPRPEVVPLETLWVFTFGTWDIWNLAALPLSSGEAVVDALIETLFNQIEKLYRASLNRESNAHSAYWGDYFDLVSPAAKDKALKGSEKRRRFEVIIPELFDISLTPGWQFRQVPPMPHVVTEHMRNSALLTERWNSRVRSQMKIWTMKGSAPPDSDQSGGDSDARQFPRRVAYHAETAQRIMEVMTEEDMQRAGETDRKGRGRLAAHEKMRFMYIEGSCEAHSNLMGHLVWEDRKRCRHPDNHLFFEPFTFNQRAVDGLAKLTATGAKKYLLERGEDKEEETKGKGKDKPK